MSQPFGLFKYSQFLLDRFTYSFSHPLLHTLMNTAELLDVLQYLVKRYSGMQTGAASNRTMNHKAVVAQTDSLFYVELHESDSFVFLFLSSDFWSTAVSWYLTSPFIKLSASYQHPHTFTCTH